jgi:hypothetical protein
VDEGELPVTTSPELGKYEEGNNKEEDLRDEAFDHATQHRSPKCVLRPGRADPEDEGCHGDCKNAVDKRLQTVLRDMVFPPFKSSCYDPSRFMGR